MIQSHEKRQRIALQQRYSKVSKDESLCYRTRTLPQLRRAHLNEVFVSLTAVCAMLLQTRYGDVITSFTSCSKERRLIGDRPSGSLVLVDIITKPLYPALVWQSQREKAALPLTKMTQTMI